jgi:hypothetical protein
MCSTTQIPGVESTAPFALDAATATLTFLTFSKADDAARPVLGVSSDLLKAKMNVNAKLSRWTIEGDSVSPLQSTELTLARSHDSNQHPPAFSFDMLASTWDMTSDSSYVAIAHNKALFLFSCSATDLLVRSYSPQWMKGLH